MLSFSVEPKLYCFYSLCIYAVRDATMFEFTAINILVRKKVKWQLQPIFTDTFTLCFHIINLPHEKLPIINILCVHF